MMQKVAHNNVQQLCVFSFLILFKKLILKK